VNVLAIDPGTKCLGWAQFVNAGLVAGGVERRDAEWDGSDAQLGNDYGLGIADGVVALGTEYVVIHEKMRVYDFRRQKGDPNDLIALAAVAAAAATAVLHATHWFGEIEDVATADWKGQVPKDIMVKRVQDKLNEHERKIAEACMKGTPKSLHHNFWDAVGIGLWRLGRL
jgi:hypothetical protein